MEGSDHVFVLPMDKPTANHKLSVALSAFHAKSDVEFGYWKTGVCLSLDSQPNSAPQGTKYYIYNITVS